MQFTVVYPLATNDPDDEFLAGSSVTAFARVAEESAFGAVAFTDHPAPSRRWLESGGHPAFDPFAALSYCSAVTEQIRLQTYLAVLPYRNPFITAKSMATVDVLSGGRGILTGGAGYLKSEFHALGVDFSRRGTLMEEAVEAIRGIWTEDSFTFEGATFSARGQSAPPRPVSQPHPPIWFGGNTRAARERVARHGDGWSPLINDPASARRNRTSIIASPSDVRRGVEELYELLGERNREPSSLDVQVDRGGQASIAVDSMSADEILEDVAAFRDAGATWAVVRPDPSGLAACLESMLRYGEEVIPELAERHGG